MKIKVRGAREHNLKNLSIDLGDGLTVVTGVSGSGKTSLIFDTVYNEARRRFLDVYNMGRATSRLASSDVDSITGIGPTIAVEQNLLNRNPNSTLASASGMHPFLRILFARFGVRHCHVCGSQFSKLTEDEIVEQVQKSLKKEAIALRAILVRRSKGSHRTLLALLRQEFEASDVLVNGSPVISDLDSSSEYDIEVVVARFSSKVQIGDLRAAVNKAAALGSGAISVRGKEARMEYALSNQCTECGTYFGDLEPKHFNRSCNSCNGTGCDDCNQTGLYPQAASVTLDGLRFTDILELSVDDLKILLTSLALPRTAARLRTEIERRLVALQDVGLGYIELNRPSPSLSRGESQRVRLAISLTSRLEDIVHLLDEPTIGQHPKDTERILPAFRNLPGPVIYVEHDSIAAAHADLAVDLGPGAGINGGEIVYSGSPKGLWESGTVTGQFFSGRQEVFRPTPRDPPKDFITIKEAKKFNLLGIDVTFPLSRFTVITGVSGSGKSTLVNHVLVPTLHEGKSIGCAGVEGLAPSPIIVDQKPIGKNPRSNPATYTKLADMIRDIFAAETDLSKSHFSFNTPEGGCTECKGMGGIEVKMRYLPSVWITCSECNGKRFKDEVLESRVKFGERSLSISEIYELSIRDVRDLLKDETRIPVAKRTSAVRVLDALVDIGLGYLSLGQPSPTLSGGESQRVKLAKYLGMRALKDKMLILDEPSTGLHAADLSGLLQVLDRLVKAGATLVVVEHNTDVIKSADWVVDLGPGAGPKGGQLLYAGPFDDLMDTRDSPTAQALREEKTVEPKDGTDFESHYVSESISVRKASANNLRDVDVDIPKGKMTVVTGISGSGKSSLVRDVLQAEAERRFYETLSVYERHATSEGPEAPVESVSGLGVTLSISSRRRRGAGYWSVYARRTTVGTVTEIAENLTVLFAQIGTRTCPSCGSKLSRLDKWVCKKCGFTQSLFKPRDFNSRTYTSACETCSGVGSQQVPMPEKLIIHPEKPICDGAMYSPGYFPKGYFCTPTSWAAGALKALGQRYDFDPKMTPWDDLSAEAKNVFLYGDPNQEPMEISYIGNRRGKKVEVTGKGKWAGFYKWVSDWDFGGTYTRTEPCKSCRGTGLRDTYLQVKILKHNIHELQSMTLSHLREFLIPLTSEINDNPISVSALRKIMTRLEFLEKVGLGYLHINRVASTLSAGEAQRLVLSSLLGSGLTSLTILLDEPTRGMHPSEVNALIDVLKDLTNEGNSVIIVEHDHDVINSADFLLDIGPGSGRNGGRVLVSGNLAELRKSDTITGLWLSGKKRPATRRNYRISRSWMSISGARENNLKNLTVRIPTDVLVGICGVSGSGKSTFMIDTIGRAIAPKKFTTSVSYEPLEPGEYDTLEGTPQKTIILDQGRKGISSPGQALDLFKPLAKIYSESEDAMGLGYDVEQITKPCTACDGNGRIRIEMGFLPDLFTDCEICNGTGYSQEAWKVRIQGISLPELNEMTLEEVYEIFKDDVRVSNELRAALDVGLGYLGLRQPSRTLSGGEIQRLKIAQEISKKSSPGTLFIFDEPTVGQHMEDVERLVEVLNRLVDNGNGVVVIEHHPHLLAACDHLIEFGPKGGPEGGYVIAQGTPLEVSNGNTPTAVHLRNLLEVKK